MSTRTRLPEPLPAEVENRLRALEARYSTVTAPPSMSMPSTPTNLWLTNLLQGVTLVTIVAFAFWLGTLSSSLKQNTEKVDKIYSIVLESKDSVSARLGVVETKLDVIDKKLDGLTHTGGQARKR